MRDLAGLIVIDYIDMDEKRNNRVVERKLKDALKSDRARIQIGRISHFGLMEMSRQRIRTSVLESSTETCPHCGGTGHVRSVSSVALQLLRAIDETLMKGATHNLIVRTRSDVAIYVLNNKRAHLRRLEERFKVTITITTDPTMTGQPAYAIDRGEQVMSVEQAKALAAQFESEMPPAPEPDPVSDEIDETDEMQTATQSEYGEREGQGQGQDERPGRRRRGRRGRGRGGEREQGAPRDQGRGPRDQVQPAAFAGDATAEGAGVDGVEDHGEQDDGAPAQAGAPREGENGDRKRRRRGRRGGRRNRRHREGNGEVAEGAPESGAEILRARRRRRRVIVRSSNRGTCTVRATRGCETVLNLFTPLRFRRRPLTPRHAAAPRYASRHPALQAEAATRLRRHRPPLRRQSLSFRSPVRRKRRNRAAWAGGRRKADVSSATQFFLRSSMHSAGNHII